MQTVLAGSESLSTSDPAATVAAKRYVSVVRPGPARLALRAATDAIHQRMHHHPALARLATGTIGRDEYRRVLAKSYGFYAVVEPVAGLSGRLTECLVCDLADLGIAAGAVTGLPRHVPLKTGDGHSERIGARYVLLGASLGGKVMARAIAKQDGAAATLPTRFLTGYGENDWNAFLAELEEALPDVDSRSRAAAAATATFAAYENWMAWNE